MFFKDIYHEKIMKDSARKAMMAKKKKTMTVELKTTKDGIYYLEFTSAKGYVYGSRKNKKKPKA